MIIINFANKDTKLHNGISTSNEYFEIIKKVVREEGKKSFNWHIKDPCLHFYDGNIAENINFEKKLKIKVNEVLNSQLIIMIIPCYWEMPISTFVNFVNIFGGTEYDNENIGNILKNKYILPIYIGATGKDAKSSADLLYNISKRLGFHILYNEITLSNFRNEDEKLKKEKVAKISKIIKLIIGKV